MTAGLTVVQKKKGKSDNEVVEFGKSFTSATYPVRLATKNMVSFVFSIPPPPREVFPYRENRDFSVFLYFYMIRVYIERGVTNPSEETA